MGSETDRKEIWGAPAEGKILNGPKNILRTDSPAMNLSKS